MKKFFALASAGLLLIMTSMVILAAMNIDRLTAACSAKAVNALQGHTWGGVTIEQLNLLPPTTDLADLSISWPRLSSKIIVTQGHEWLAGKRIILRMAPVQIMLDGLFSGTFLISAESISAAIEDRDSAAADSASDTITGLSEGTISASAHLKLWPPGGIKQQIQGLMSDLSGLLHTGSTSIPISFSGICSFFIHKEIVTAKLTVQQKDNSYRLTMDRESLQIISWIMAEKLTEPEVELLSVNPFKAPRLLRIRDDAQNSARIAHEEHAVVPEDAYRHVLWSYLLTKAYGEDFAKQVTDAHEQGVTDNTPAEHRMDYANNTVGRRYQAQGYKRDELLSRLLNDPQVILEANGQVPSEAR